MIHILILGFDTVERCDRTLRRFKEDTDSEGLILTITLIDAQYPERNKAKTAFWDLSEKYETDLLLLGRNHGQDGNYNRIKELMKFKDDDIIVYFDTDFAPKKRTWLKETLRVFSKPDAGFVCMNCLCTDDALANQGEHFIIDEIPVREICWPGGWPNGVWRGAFLNKTVLAQSHKFYGGTEGNILNALRANDYKGYMLEEHDDARDLMGQEGAYQAWKVSVIAKSGEQESYTDYLTRTESTAT